MRLTLNVDGESFEVETDSATSWVRVKGRQHAVRLLSTGPDRVELEIGGERAVVAAWPLGSATPPKGVSVNGELALVELTIHEDGRAPASSPEGPALGRPSPAAAAPEEHGGEGVAIQPPMPGKIIEVRVKDGDLVAAGQLLLVLEAMKMRNEVSSPVAGRVAGIRVVPGQAVRSGELLLRVVA
jgi:biotin carboxyl carrier protein